MNKLTHVELLEELWKEVHINNMNGPAYQYIESHCISTFRDDVDNFVANPEWVEYHKEANCLYRTKEGELRFHYLKTRWSGGQAVALDIARTKIIPVEWNNIVQKRTTITEHIDQGKNVGSERIVEIRLRKDDEAIVITMSKNKIISTNHFYEA